MISTSKYSAKKCYKRARWSVGIKFRVGDAFPIQTGKNNLRKINDLYLVSTQMPQISLYT